MHVRISIDTRSSRNDAHDCYFIFSPNILSKGRKALVHKFLKNVYRSHFIQNLFRKLLKTHVGIL